MSVDRAVAALVESIRAEQAEATTCLAVSAWWALWTDVGDVHPDNLRSSFTTLHWLLLNTERATVPRGSRRRPIEDIWPAVRWAAIAPESAIEATLARWVEVTHRDYVKRGIDLTRFDRRRTELEATIGAIRATLGPVLAGM